MRPSEESPDLPELHIAGVLVHAQPAQRETVARVLGQLPGTEVCAVTPQGKLVVVCECASADEALERIADMRATAGVVDVALVYQHAESAAALQEPMPGLAQGERA